MGLDKKILIRHESEWGQRLLRHELNSLKKEHEHLLLRNKERPLTKWEETRKQEILDEVMQMLMMFSNQDIESIIN